MESEESHGKGKQRGKEEVYLLGKLKDCFKKEPYIKAQIDLNRPGWSQGMKKQDKPASNVKAGITALILP